MSKKRIATVWLDGCSGCHMSFLDMDERLIELFQQADLVYSPLVDLKEFPENVDITLVEGAVSSEEDLHKIRVVRANTKILVAFGDCAVTGNVPSMRNSFGVNAVLQRAYRENVTLYPQVPREVIPALCERVRPVHEVVKVDVFIPGCPPSAETIYLALSDLLADRMPDTAKLTRFGT
ncbi:MAG: NADP oxidoreductase [Armatimonadota bacterium]